MTTPATSTPAVPKGPEATGLIDPVEAAKLNTLFEKVQGNCWVLHFLKQNKPDHKNFFSVGDIHKAISRAKSHCEIIGVRFLSVRPMFADFGADEKRVQDIS